MKVLLAVGNEDLSKILKKNLVEAAFDVLDSDVYHRNFLPELLDMERPDIIILHDAFLPSDTTSKEDNEKELFELISSWRILYDDTLRVVLICERNRHDAFLRSLVAYNVLDIFPDRSIPTSIFINQLREAPIYANVAKFGIGDWSEPFTETNMASEIVEEEEQQEIITSGTDVRMNRLNRFQLYMNKFVSRNQANKQLEPPSERKVEPVELVEEESNPLKKETKEPEISKASIPNENVLSRKNHRANRSNHESSTLHTEDERLIGTVLLAVTSIGHNVGATHTSIQIASHLKRKGNSVAIVEGNPSGDFERLQELFVDDKDRWDIPFLINDIPHYPFAGEEENIIPFLSEYQYVVIDLGSYEKTPWFTEFFRSQKRLVVASGGDWKLAFIGDFIKKHGKVPFHVIVPMASKDLISDLEEIYEGSTTFDSLPYHSNPYLEQADTNEVLNKLLKGFRKQASPSNSNRKLKVLLLIASTIAVIGLFGMTFMYFS